MWLGLGTHPHTTENVYAAGSIAILRAAAGAMTEGYRRPIIGSPADALGVSGAKKE
jgi:hypothetical protein